MAMKKKYKEGAYGAVQPGLQGALSGASVGAAIGGPAAPMTALIGAGIGLAAGGLAGYITTSKQYSDAAKLAKRQAKLAKQAARAETKGQIAGMGAQQTAEAFNAAAQVPAGGVSTTGGSSSGYDQYHLRTYGA